MFDETVIQAIRRNDCKEVKSFNISDTDKDEDGWNLLHYAAKFGSLEVANFLINENHTDYNVKNFDGNKPLHIAADWGHKNIVELFLNKTLSVDDPGKDSWTPLHYAANKDHLNLVSFLIEKKANISALDKNRWTPLHYAAANGHLPVVEFLIENEAKINIENSKNSDNKTPLELASEGGHEQITNLLRNELLLAAVRQKDRTGVQTQTEVETQINGGANINYARQDGWTPLHHAVSKGDNPEDLTFIKFLIEKEANVNAKNSVGNKPLHIASGHGYNKTVNFFLDEQGLSVNDQGADNWTPLHYAADKPYLELGKALMKKANINIDARDRSKNQTPLHHAASKGHKEFVELLIEKEANINSENFDSKTPLQLTENMEIKKILLGKALIDAVRQNNIPKVEEYISEGAKFNYSNVNYSYEGNKWKPLHYAASLGYRRPAEMLIKSNNATIDARDFENNTPLHIAADYGKENVVGLLLDNKANVDGPGKDNWVPLHYAANKGHLQVARLLVEKGAKINSDNKSPLQLARDNNYQTIVKLLLNELLLNAVNTADGLDIGKVEEYLKEGSKEGVEINHLDHHGWTPLHHAANRTSEALDLIRLLVREGADVNATAYSGDKPLHTASSHAHTNVVKFFIEEKGLDVNDRGEENLTPLHYAVKKGSKAFVKFLIKKGADIYAENSNSTTPLELANDLEVKKILLGEALINAVRANNMIEVKKYISKNETDVSYSREDNRWTSLHYAASLGYRRPAEMLIKSNNATIDARDFENNTPLHIAADYGKEDVVRLLLNNKANVDEPGKDNWVPLHYAVNKGHLQVARLLVEKGAKINPDNNSPLQLAKDNNHQAIVKLLLNELLLNAVNTADELDIGKVEEYLKEGAEINHLDHHGWTPLHYAANRTSEALGLIRLLVRERADVNATAYSGDKPLHTASNHAHTNVVKFFIEEKGLDVNDRGGGNLTPLHHAVKKGNKAFVEFLIKKEADIYAKDSNSTTPLDLANLIKKEADIYAKNSNSTTPLDLAKLLASSGISRKEIRDILLGKALIDAVRQDDISKARDFISKRADVEYSYEDRRWRPLHYAAELGYQMVAEVLIGSNATVIDAKDRDGNNPMHIAAKYGHKNIVEFFLKDPRKHLGENEAKLIECREKNDWTPLHYAAKEGHIRIVQFLVQKGANINAQDSQGKLPIDLASEHEVIQFLLNEALARAVRENKVLEVTDCLNKEINGTKADVDYRDQDERTPLHHAARYGYPNIVRSLVQSKADVNATDLNNWTPLHQTAEGGHLKVLEFLVEKQANINAKNSDDEKTLHIAAKNGHENVVKFLLNENRLNADVNDPGNNNWTPLHYAAEKGHSAVVELLVAKEANIDAKNSDGKIPLQLAKDEKVKELLLNKALFYAVKQDNILKVEECLGQGANVDCLDQDNKWTLLHYAASDGYQKLVTVLIEKEADINAKNSDGNKPLHIAAEKGHKNVVELLIDKKLSVNDQGKNNWTPLHYAAANNHFNVVRYLVEEKRADINLKDYQDNKPLHVASENGHKDIVEFFLNKKLSVNDPGKNSWTPLHYAADKGHLAVVELLIEKGANIDAKNSNDETPLQLAIEKGHQEIVKLLQNKALFDAVKQNDISKVKGYVNNGANVNSTNKWGWRVLHAAAARGNLSVIKFLVEEKEADINAKTNDGDKPLHIAAEKGYVEVIKFFLNKELNIDDPGKSNWTPLHYAAKYNYPEIVDFLIKKGANVSAKSSDGEIPLQLATDGGIIKLLQNKALSNAVRQGNDNEVKEYLDSGADVNYSDWDNWTVLHDASSKGHLKIVEVLTAKGANVNARDSDGNKPLHVAATYCRENIVEFFLKEPRSGLSVNDLGENNWTPLHYAAKEGHIRIVQFLVQKGANIDAQDSQGKLPIDLASEHEVIQFLLNEALARAVRENKVLEVTDCLNKEINGTKADVDYRGQNNGTLLHHAAQHGYFNIVELLVKYGADVNATDIDKWTPLHCASKDGSLNVVIFLTDNQADINAKNSDRDKPLHIAVKNGHYSVVRFFIRDKKMSVDDKGKDDWTPLQYAVAGNHSQIASFLLEKGSASWNGYSGNVTALLAGLALAGKNAGISAENNKGKIPLWLTKGQNVIELFRKPRPFSQELFAKINVPADGSCLFWATTLAYLIPVRYSDNAFKEKFNRLFGSLSPAELEQVQSLIKEYNPYSNSMAIRNSETLQKLVTEKFRNRVIDEMLRDRSRFEESITVHDFLHSRNTGYITGGKFQEKFHSEFSTEIGEHNIDIDKLKPSTLNEDTVKEIDNELDKIPDQNKVKQFKFATYVECMRDSKAWGGNHEIQAMSRILHSNILVFSDGAKHPVGCDSCNDQIQLFNDGESHYNFGLVKVQALIEAIKNNKQQETKTYLSIGIDDINYQDSEDWTALHFAAQHGNTEVLQLLLEQGASVNIENSVGQTAIDVARLFEKNDVVDILSRQSQAVPSQVEQPLTFNKRHGISGIEGQFYEIRLPMLFLLQGLVKKGDKKINNFYLATNMEEAGDFDDVVFKYEYKDPSGVAKSRVIFLQAKHRENPGKKGEKVTVERLLSEAESEDFSLKKYFISYRKIKKQFSKTANDPVLKSKFEDCDFIIYTNALSTFSSAGNIIKEGNIEENDFLKILDSQNKYYQLEFNSDKKEEIVNVLKNSSDCRRLAKELATSIFSGRIIDMQKDIFKSYHLSLVEKVIEKTEPKEGKLKRDFLDDDESLSVGDKEFRRVFLEEAEKVFKKQGNALKRELKNKTVRLSDKFGVNNENVSPSPLPNDLVSEGEINEFLSKLKLFVDQPDKRKLGAIIKSKIQEVYKVEQQDIDSVFSDVKYQIISRRWWQSGNNYLTENNRFFQDAVSDLGNLRRKQAAIILNSLAGDRQEEKELLEGALPMKKISDSSIQHYGMQQKSYSRLFQFISHNIPNAKVQSVKQGLYLPSFEAREIKINGKCAAITRTFSQMLFFDSVFLAGQFLQNMEISAELYERLAQGKQISAREEREIFDFSRVLDKFEQQLDSSTSSLPSSLSHIKSYKQSDDLLRYVSDLTGDFAIHLVTSNHVVAIYRVEDIYAYFDSNVAFVSNLKSIFQLIRVLEKAVAFAGYEIAEDGFLVEYFDATKANDALTAKQKQTLMKPIQTERHLLSLQDQRLGHINLNGKQVSRVTLYDLGTKLHLEGSSPILINSDMNLSSENLLAYLNAGKISITAREYLESLRNSVVDTALVQTTKIIPFAGSRNEVKHAQQIQELLSSDAGSKLKSYELNDLLKSPIEKSIKALSYYLEVANSKHWPNRLTNAAGRIQLIRGVHGAAVSCDRERGNTKDCLLNTGEISLSLVSQLIEDKIVQNVPKLIKSLKTVKFGTHILRGGAAIISNPFDVYDIIDSAIDLHNCEKGSNECKDAIAAITFSSTSLASGVVLTAIGAPGVGTAVGLIIMVAQGAYGGGRAIEEFQPYRLTFDENFRLFWHVFALQPVPTDIEYIKARKDIVSQIAKQIWEQLQNRSEHVVAHVTGLGDVTFKEELECKSVQKGLDRYQACTHRKVRVPILSPSNAVISMDKDNADTSKLARIIPDLPSSEAKMICLPKWLGVKVYEYRKVPTDEKDCYNNRCLTRYETVPYYNQIPTTVYSCDNAMVISHKERTNQIQVSGNKKIIFDLNLVNQGMIVGSDKWHNDFIIYQGKAKVLGGENTRNTFILTSDFVGTIFGGKNSTNILDVSNLSSSNYSLYIDNLSLFDRISYIQDYTTNKKQVEEQTNKQAHFCGINNVIISANTTVKGNGDRYTFYIKPNAGYSKINVSKGSIIFPETALLLDCDRFTYSPESNVLSMKFNNFTLDIANYFNRDQQICNFELIDKHGSTVEPLVDLAQNNSQEVKLFNLRAETELTYNNITGWYENIAKASGEYQVYGTVRVKYPIAQERYGFYPHKIFGSEKSDVIPLTKETWSAEGRKGSDSYNVILGGSESSITTEINNYAEDKSLDLLYMPVNSIQAKRNKDDLLLYATNSTHPVKVKGYFLGDNYQHLVVINDNKDTFISLEGPSEDVSLVPFYHPTDNQHIFSLAAEKVTSNSEVIVDAKLDDIRFYRDGNDLLLMDDKPLVVKLENFYDKYGNLTLNFWHHNHKDKLSSEQLFELAKLAINYQNEIKSTYYDNVKEYIVSASNTTIHHNQKFVNSSLTTVEPSTKRVGVLVLQDPSDVEVLVDNEDLVFFVTQNNATFTIKNWNDTDHRISALKFNREEKSIEVTGLDKFDLSQVSEIQSLINKAALSSIASQQLEKLDSNVVNGIKYLLAVRGIENGTSTHKCLGFDSAEEEQQFISAYHSSYSSGKLSQVLHHNQASEALVWLVVKGYTDLSLENQSIDRKNDLNKCFNAVTNKRIISRIVRKLEVENIEAVVPNVESFIRHHKEALEDRIVNSLRSNTTEIDTEEGTHQRKRRDESEVKGYENSNDQAFFNTQNHATFTIKNNQVTSGTSKLSSWVNSVVSTVSNGISKLFSLTKISSLPAINVEYHNNFQNNNATTPNINVDDTILLLDVLIRKITGQKYIPSANQNISLLEAQASALNMTEEFSKVMSSELNVPAGELVNLPEMQSKIFKAVISDNGSKVADILHSYAIGGEKAGDVLAALQTTAKASSKSKEKSNYHNCHFYEVKPRSCLSNIAIEGPDINYGLERAGK